MAAMACVHRSSFSKCGRPMHHHISITMHRTCCVRHSSTALHATQTRVQGAHFDDVVQQLALETLQKVGQPEPSTSGRNSSNSSSSSSSSNSPSSNSKYIVGVAGAPGSGKTTLALLVCAAINQLAGAGPEQPIAAVVPMDGFHFYRWELDAMPDPQLAHARRGAHWTFDAAAFVECMRTLRGTGTASVPSFDHAVGDPVPDDILVSPSTRIIIVEGNYLLLEEEPWRQLRSLFDDTWFVECPLDVAMQRVFERQVAIGLASEVSKARIATNDRPNAELIAATAKSARLVVPSDIPFRQQC